MKIEKYTCYCTGFYIEEYKEIWFWDEIAERRIKKISVKNKDEAIKILKQWKENAPNNCICEIW